MSGPAPIRCTNCGEPGPWLLVRTYRYSGTQGEAALTASAIKAEHVLTSNINAQLTGGRRR